MRAPSSDVDSSFEPTDSQLLDVTTGHAVDHSCAAGSPAVGVEIAHDAGLPSPAVTVDRGRPDTLRVRTAVAQRDPTGGTGPVDDAVDTQEFAHRSLVTA